jgi:hypothetical protein
MLAASAALKPEVILDVSLPTAILRLRGLASQGQRWKVIVLVIAARV